MRRRADARRRRHRPSQPRAATCELALAARAIRPRSRPRPVLDRLSAISGESDAPFVCAWPAMRCTRMHAAACAEWVSAGTTTVASTAPSGSAMDSADGRCPSFSRQPARCMRDVFPAHTYSHVFICMREYAYYSRIKTPPPTYLTSRLITQIMVTMHRERRPSAVRLWHRQPLGLQTDHPAQIVTIFTMAS